MNDGVRQDARDTQAFGTEIHKAKNQNVFHATIHAIEGLRELALEKSARRELAAIVTASLLLVYWPGVYSFTLFVLCFVLLAMESLNSAIEAVCDHVTPELHPAMKKAKDLGAAAIFILCLLMGLVLALFLVERLTAIKAL